MTAIPPAEVRSAHPTKAMVTRRSIVAYAAFWASGAAVLWWPWILVRAIAARRRPARVPVPAVVTCGLLALSLAVAAVLRPNPFRVLAATANLAIWFTLLYWSSRDWKPGEIDGVIQGIVDLAVIQGGLTIAAFAIYPTLSGSALPMAHLLPRSLLEEPNVGFLATIRLAYPDYFGHAVLRTAGLFGNATWAGGFAGLSLILLLFGDDRLSPFVRRAPVRLLFLAVCAHTLYVAYARVSVVAVVSAVLAYGAVRHQGIVPARTVVGAGCLLLAALIVVSPAVPLRDWIRKGDEPRQGSLKTRSEIYGTTVNRVENSSLPLIGAGIKERESGLVASVGSHSTYLGLAYRGGILCALSYAFLLCTLLARSWRQHAPLAFGMTVFVLVWCATEDIDAGNLVPLGLLTAFCLVAERGLTRTSVSIESPVDPGLVQG